MRRPIGLFDSGAGGLFVLENLQQAFPEQDFIFLADTKHFPYGEKTDREIQQLAFACAKTLEARGCASIIVACNTAAAFSLNILQSELSIPVLGPIESAATEAKAKTRNGKIGVLATRATVRSKIYEKYLDHPIVCESPLLASLVQEAQVDLLEDAVQNYALPLLEAGIDTLILGCTHYPIVEQFLAKYPIAIVDSAKSFIKEVQPTGGNGQVEYIVTGEPLPAGYLFSV